MSFHCSYKKINRPRGDYEIVEYNDSNGQYLVMKQRLSRGDLANSSEVLEVSSLLIQLRVCFFKGTLHTFLQFEIGVDFV